MPANIPAVQPVTGGELRRRVRRITAACVGLATIASAALTVNFAWAANDDQGSVTAGETTSTSGATSGNSVATGSAAPDTGAPATSAPPSGSSTLAAPQQAPAAGSGRSHTQSGGS